MFSLVLAFARTNDGASARERNIWRFIRDHSPPASRLLLKLFDATCYVNARGRGPPPSLFARETRSIDSHCNNQGGRFNVLLATWSSHLTAIQPLDNRKYHRTPRRMIIIILASDGIDTLGDAELSSTVVLYVVPSASYCWPATASL